MKVFAMVTTKPSWEYTSYAIKSFFRNTQLDDSDRVFLIDNDSGFEEDASWFSPILQIIKNDKPLGFSANMNQVLRIAKSNNADFFVLHNDIIFTSDWISPLLEDDSSVTSSLSNMHTEFEIAGFDWNAVMKLNQYLGKESKLKEIIKLHKEKTDGYKKMFSLPFFALRIPNKVFSKVGELDEAFQTAGYEDHDYCLRTHQAGFEVKYAKKSLLLHFVGKSTWAGAERHEVTEARLAYNKEIFEKKWGKELLSLCTDNNHDVLNNNDELIKLYLEEKYKELIDKLCP